MTAIQLTIKAMRCANVPLTNGATLNNASISYMRRVKFNGASGPVAFVNSSTNREFPPTLMIYNVQQSSFKAVGSVRGITAYTTPGVYSFFAPVYFPGLEVTPIRQFRIGILGMNVSNPPAGTDFPNLVTVVKMAATYINSDPSLQSIIGISPVRKGRDRLKVLPSFVRYDDGTVDGAVAAVASIFSDSNLNKIRPQAIVGSPMSLAAMSDPRMKAMMQLYKVPFIGVYPDALGLANYANFPYYMRLNLGAAAELKLIAYVCHTLVGQCLRHVASP